MALSCISPPISRSVIRSFPNDLFLLSDFKAFVNGLVLNTTIPQKFHPRLYSYADFIYVKLYAVINNRSVHWAAESLNRYLLRIHNRKFSLHSKRYSDKKRFRRLIPHQTDVDKFFRLFSENEVHYVFGNCLTALSDRIRKKALNGTKMKMMVDNTEYAYYGCPQPPYDIGTNRKQGTKRCHLFQGLCLHGNGITLFTEFRALQKGQYRSKYIGIWTEWMKRLGFCGNAVLMDREFYRASLIKELKTRKIRVLIPAKKYMRVKHAIAKYLCGTGPLVSRYFFSQTIGAKPYPSSVHVALVVVGHKNRPASTIRRLYHQGVWGYDKAIRNLSAFFTTLESWKNENRWAKYLTSTYKIRWNEETAFSKLNQIHIRFRPRKISVHLANMYLRAIIYNNWQYYRKIKIHDRYLPRYISLFDYLDELKRVLENQIFMSVKKNTGYLMERKRRAYFKV